MYKVALMVFLPFMDIVLLILEKNFNLGIWDQQPKAYGRRFSLQGPQGINNLVGYSLYLQRTVFDGNWEQG